MLTELVLHFTKLYLLLQEEEMILFSHANGPTFGQDRIKLKWLSKENMVNLSGSSSMLQNMANTGGYMPIRGLI
ncbi:hypothetical protein V6N12_057887 [Hibiscus sabdariffa]|uniref:Uncharacterized protein n=1 Tax=Hibiscus sabdariffa TaxID=183260 RepID=A0ABR2B3Z6_9ROSI